LADILKLVNFRFTSYPLYFRPIKGIRKPVLKYAPCESFPLYSIVCKVHSDSNVILTTFAFYRNLFPDNLFEATFSQVITMFNSYPSLHMTSEGVVHVIPLLAHKGCGCGANLGKV